MCERHLRGILPRLSDTADDHVSVDIAGADKRIIGVEADSTGGVVRLDEDSLQSFADHVEDDEMAAELCGNLPLLVV